MGRVEEGHGKRRGLKNNICNHKVYILRGKEKLNIPKPRVYWH